VPREPLNDLVRRGEICVDQRLPNVVRFETGSILAFLVVALRPPPRRKLVEQLAQAPHFAYDSRPMSFVRPMKKSSSTTAIPTTETFSYTSRPTERPRTPSTIAKAM
jgi:hypothetical protein